MAGNQYSGGMLGNLFSNSERASRQEDLDEEKRLGDLARMDGFTADRLATYQGANMAGQGLGGIVAAAAGKDPRSPATRNEQAIQAAKAQVAQLGFNPDDPKSMDDFYKKVIAILQGQGLVAEAMAVATEYRAEKLKTQEGELKVRDLQRKETKDAADIKNTEERNAILKANGIPEFAKYVDILEKAVDPLQRKLYLDRLNQMSGGKVVFEDAGDRVIMRNQRGELLGTDVKGLDPKADAKKAKADQKEVEAYASIKADMQRQADRAAELYRHPGLPGITGRLGRLVGTEGAAGQTATTLASGPARAALDLHTSVVGGTLMTGLMKLKTESKTGASGLGALSEQEGRKVQSDTAALERNQEAADLRLRLSQYVDEIMAAGLRLDDKAKEAEAAVVPLVKPLLKKGAPSQPQEPAVAAPVTAPAAPAAGRVRVKAPDGREGTVTADKLEAAKANGYTEIK